jgi:thiol-disulfide isomerase/thioredoxin
MRALAFLPTIMMALPAGAQTPAASLWNEAKAKLDRLTGLHQEFDATRVFVTAKAGQVTYQRQTVIDMAHGQWREKTVTGYGNWLWLFDGKSTVRMDEGGSEFYRAPRRPDEEDPGPAPYSAISDADWPKAVELERRPCGPLLPAHVCAVVQVPLKKLPQTAELGASRMVDGTARAVLDTGSGVLVEVSTRETFDDPAGRFQFNADYVLKRVRFGPPASPALFKLPAARMREVRSFPWNAAKIRKVMVGKPAPELALVDLQGKVLNLSALRGRVVLLVFWATWCPTCRGDAPALDTLHAQYGRRDLSIIGISVDENRATVEKFLSEHPRNYPIVLTTENLIPVPYQMYLYPTYLAIGRDGKVAAAAEGGYGYDGLLELLDKTGW